MLSYLSSFDPANLFTLTNAMAILLGSFIGMLIGALPGLGATFCMVIILPITYRLDPIASILILLSGFQSANYGGSISSIILGIPGTPGAVPTMLDGSPLAKNNQSGKALAYSLLSSTVGGFSGGFIVLLLAQPIASVAMKFSAPEFFLIAIMGVCIATTLSSKDFLKGLISITIGLAISTVGTDMFTGFHRFNMGIHPLVDGVKITVMLIGIHAISEVFEMISTSLHMTFSKNKESLNTKLTKKEIMGVIRPMTIGSIIGPVIGTIPGLGSATAPWISYSVAEKTSKTKKMIPFGTGNPEGVAAAESANNGGVGGELIPLLVFGIPSTPVVAVVMSAFIIQGIKPGPMIFVENPSLVSTILVGFIFTTVAMYTLGRLLTPFFARVLAVPNRILIPLIVMFSIVGSYAGERELFDITVMIFLGVLGFVLKKLDFSLAGVVLSFVLGKIIEENFRRTLLISKGSFSIFFTRVPSLILIGILIVILVASFYFKMKRNKILELKNLEELETE